MSYPSGVRFCPRCGTRLVRRDDRGHPRPTCPSCHFIVYRNPAPAAGVILLDQDGAVLLVRRRYQPAAGAWCLPAGFMEYGESPRRCAVRELFEETGVRVRLTALFGVYAGFDDPRVRAVLILYRGKRSGGRLKAGDDATDARFFRLTRLPRRIAFASHRRALEELRAMRSALSGSRPPAMHRGRTAPHPASTRIRSAPGALIRPRSRPGAASRDRRASSPAPSRRAARGPDRAR